MKFIAIFILILLFTLPAFAQDSPPVPEIGVDEKLGEFVPLDLTFFDEEGKEVTLKDLVDNKPTILNLVYYRCPGICSPIMSGLAETLGELRLDPNEYSVITISFDPTETSETASEKKKNYFNTFELDNKSFPESTWRFLVGDRENTTKITKATGFKYKEEGGEFIHPGVLIVLSPKGKISRYLYGIEFLRFDLEMALTEASEGKVGPAITRVLSFCFSYNPRGKRYVFDVIKIVGIATVIFVIIFLIFLKKYTGKKKGKNNGGE